MGMLATIQKLGSEIMPMFKGFFQDSFYIQDKTAGEVLLEWSNNTRHQGDINQHIRNILALYLEAKDSTEKEKEWLNSYKKTKEGDALFNSREGKPWAAYAQSKTVEQQRTDAQKSKIPGIFKLIPVAGAFAVGLLFGSGTFLGFGLMGGAAIGFLFLLPAIVCNHLYKRSQQADTNSAATHLLRMLRMVAFALPVIAAVVCGVYIGGIVVAGCLALAVTAVTTAVVAAVLNYFAQSSLVKQQSEGKANLKTKILQGLSKILLTGAALLGIVLMLNFGFAVALVALPATILLALAAIFITAVGYFIYSACKDTKAGAELKEPLLPGGREAEKAAIKKLKELDENANPLALFANFAAWGSGLSDGDDQRTQLNTKLKGAFDAFRDHSSPGTTAMNVPQLAGSGSIEFIFDDAPGGGGGGGTVRGDGS